VGGLFGVGGASIAIPVIGIFFGESQQLAQGTAFVLVAPALAVSVVRYFRVGNIDLRMGFATMAGALPFALAGALFATSISSKYLRIAYACFLIVLMIEYGLRALRAKKLTPTKLPWPYAALVGAVAGSISGLFTVGGSLLSISANTWLFGISQLAAQGLALVFQIPSCIIGTIVYARAGQVDWHLAIPLAVGGVLTVTQGVDVAHRLPERTLRLLYIAYISISALSLLWKALSAP
jgi:uncharacterized membrane protein YfcA